MASNLSTIGFHFADEQQFRNEMMGCAAQASQSVECPVGRYGIWSSRSGAQIWFHLGRTESGETEILGLTPFFEGKSEVMVALRRVVPREADNAFEGALEGVVTAQGPAEGGGYPLIFDAVDFALSGAQQFPVERQVRLSAFARELQAYADDAAFLASQEGSERPAFATQAFIPVGMFAKEQGDEGDLHAGAIPESTVFFTGRVVELAQLANEKTGRAFLWMLVETIDATLDVIADPVVIHGEAVEGGIVAVSALLFGRILA